jgi:hypothetical protein
VNLNRKKKSGHSWSPQHRSTAVLQVSTLRKVDSLNMEQQQYQPSPKQQQYQLPPQQPKYTPDLPTYNKAPAGGPNGEKMDFNQTFHVVKPKYNDIWAALLFIATFAGSAVVSAFAIQGYSATKLFQGGTIYGGASTVGLSTNTIIFLYVFSPLDLAHTEDCSSFVHATAFFHQLHILLDGTRLYEADHMGYRNTSDCVRHCHCHRLHR